ncbi:MAG: hypothetical protein JNM88_18980 [Chitinophagaceae bacterium]|nr:hypothetical protein [Chitinophagaceae bacterium]
MGNNKKTSQQSRRDFFASLLSKTGNKKKGDTVKMLTADGKLVEVDKTVVEQAANRQKAGNKTIYNWMNNPCKK